MADKIDTVIQKVFYRNTSKEREAALALHTIGQIKNKVRGAIRFRP